MVCPSGDQDCLEGLRCGQQYIGRDAKQSPSGTLGNVAVPESRTAFGCPVVGTKSRWAGSNSAELPKYQDRGGRDVDGSGELTQLRPLCVDATTEHRLLLNRRADLRVEVRDRNLDDCDLALDILLLGGVVPEGLLQLLLRGQRVGQVASKLRAYLVDQRLLLLRVGCRRARGDTGRTRAEH